MEAVGGDLHLAGNNVNIRAKTDLHLIGSKVLLQGGDGAGGVVEVVANSFKQIQYSSTMKLQVV